MSTVQTDYFRQAGKSAIAAGVFLFLSVAAELIRPVQEENGTVTNRGLFAVYVALGVLGAAALVYTLIRLRRLDIASGQERSRSGRVGIWLSLAGGVLLILFALTAGATGIIQGSPLEASFALFGLGLLLLVIGQLHSRLPCARGECSERSGLLPSLVQLGLSSQWSCSFPLGTIWDCSPSTRHGSQPALG